MKLIKFAMAIGVIALIFLLLIIGQDLLLPLVIAIAIWYLINVLASGIARLKIMNHGLPMSLCLAAALLLFFGFITIVVQFISGSLNDLGGVTREYEANLRAHWESLPFADSLPVEGLAQYVTDQFDISSIFAAVALSFTSIAADGTLIVIYVGFLLFEQRFFNAKLSAFMADASREKRMLRILERVRGDVRKYISIKLFTSALTGTLSYILLSLLEINFAEIWALLIFLLNFIPTIGSIIATIFPALIALAQSNEGFALFLIVLVAIGTLQVCIGNVLEPRLMGASLNLSPIVILFNLALWGSIWGIPGMFLCVPLLIITTIVLSHFPKTRPIAIVLSSNGQIDIAED
jgi:AI-2 transport protein TqsA